MGVREGNIRVDLCHRVEREPIGRGLRNGGGD